MVLYFLPNIEHYHTIGIFNNEVVIHEIKDTFEIKDTDLINLMDNLKIKGPSVL